MKLIVLAIFFSLFSNFCLAQKTNNPKLIPYELNEKWGFINDKGKIVIEPKYDEAYKFSDGLARVSIGLNVGFIDGTGRFVIKPEYRCAHSFSEGLAPVAKDCQGFWGYIDQNGNKVIEPKFDWAGQFHNGLAEVLVNVGKDSYDGKTGYIDKSGNFVIEPKFDDSESFFDGLAMFAEDKKRNDGASAYFNRKAFMDTKGKIITPFFNRAESFSEGLAAVEINDRWGFIDKRGNIKISPQFDFVIREFSEGIAFVNCDNDKTAAIDKTGKYITECIFDEAWGFSEGLAAVQYSGKFGFINRKGKFVIKPQFSNADSFYNGLAKVGIVKENWFYEGYVNHKGEYVVKPVKKEEIKQNVEKVEIE
jgi:hypothetical protein